MTTENPKQGEDKKLYIVQKEGIWLREVFGVYDDPFFARKRADQLAYNDSDGYHEWAVYGCFMNGTSTPESVYKTRKGLQRSVEV